ncbi:Na+/H+ antiporter NhaA [Patescibacteria group bacterium]|nr:Na+/H+ antiporter NhaA [Patescibacteria group bacterium]
MRILFEFSGFLIGGTLIALVWANVAHHSYEYIAHEMHFFVNDILMAFFFALAGKEVWEAMLPGGVLSSPRKAAMPLLATVGGMTGPILIYVGGCLLLQRMDLVRGWAIPCATDIAFSYLVARIVFGAKHPAIPFLLLLAIADDAGGLIILATCYPTGDVNALAFFGLVSLAIVSGLMMKKAGIKSFWPYLIIAGPISWCGFHFGGIHPALSLVPIIPTLPHAKRDLGLFAEEGQPVHQHDALNEFEHWWKNPVELILGLFGFVNAGVAFGSIGLPTGLVFAGLLIGKPLGITLFALLGRLFGLTLPDGMNMRDLVTLGMAAAVGFTVALFVSTVAFPAGENLEASKMGALGSFAAFLLTIIVGRVLRVQRVER